MTDFRPDPATAAQIAAADPDSNVWLVANAGSGKTKVLTDRVARLLLRGVDPQNILCLTYTKAAAAEMQNRLFKRLGAWAMTEDGELRGNLVKLGEGARLTDEALRRARQLFARAIETPGGIRIQTIHSFCAGLLRRFPLEAGVSPAFTELDDRSSAVLRAEILEEMSEGPDSALFETILPEIGERIDGLLQQIVGQRAGFLKAPNLAELRLTFGLPEDMDRAGLVEDTFGAGDLAMLADVAKVLKAAKGKTDPVAGDVMARITCLNLASLETLEGLFLYKTGEKAGLSKEDKFPTKESRAALGALLDHLQGLMRRVEDARPLRLALVAAEKAHDLHLFAHAFLTRYEAAKAKRGWIDFDDFITRATALLTNPAIAPWVLFRLDGAIDHVLVDEAQDTSPAQWRIVAALTEEFTAGEGARDTERSLFVVGDKKQSIYSFQGADVVEFDRWKADFAARFEGAESALQELPLVHSFRSSRTILSLVDHAFPEALRPALGGDFLHTPFLEQMPGKVEIWPPVPKPQKAEPKEWFDPIDMVGETDAAVVLTENLAIRIREMIEAGVQIPDHGSPSGFRAVRAGDFLVLVQRRGAIFEAMIRACKAQGLPIAGPDRLTLSEELAVRDIMALLNFLNTPEDDLALATALRSPIFGWSEDQLYALAQPRKGYLWEALRQNAPQPHYEAALEILNDLRRQSDFLRPHDLIDRILTRHRGRVKLLGRLGAEAADAIDELSQQALAYERGDVPSLTGFLVWMSAGEIEVKRQAESEGHVIRVMTVHGSKGLEAPIVVMPDTADRRLDERALILPLQEGPITWAGRKESDTAPVAEVKSQRVIARAAENLRLLYVAMTRAKCWLMVAAAGEAGESSWHGIIKKGAEAMGATPDENGLITLSGGLWPENAPEAAHVAKALAPPAYALTNPTPAPALPRLYSPSGLGGEHIVVDLSASRTETDDEDLPALERGTTLHLALQYMAEHGPEDWPEILTRLKASPTVAQEARAIMADPSLAWAFGAGSLAEVEVASPWKDGYLAGSIDRLVIESDRVVIIDFKSNRSVPMEVAHVPEAYLRQLGAYALVMAQLYPEKRIETAILWTRLPLYMPIPIDMVRSALSRSTSA